MADSPPADMDPPADATRDADVAERITVGVPPAGAYQAISDVHRMARWSPECFAVLVWSRRGGLPARFVGLNRRGPWVWFTTCQVVTARPAEEFAFDVTTFGMPVSRWTYRLAAVYGAPRSRSAGGTGEAGVPTCSGGSSPAGSRTTAPRPTATACGPPWRG